MFHCTDVAADSKMRQRIGRQNSRIGSNWGQIRREKVTQEIKCVANEVVSWL